MLRHKVLADIQLKVWMTWMIEEEGLLDDVHLFVAGDVVEIRRVVEIHLSI